MRRAIANLSNTFGLAALILSSGCTVIGPASIRSGRPAYNDAILQTGDEQLLQNVVRLRFGDSLGFLTVASVTATMTATGTTRGEVPFGPKSAYEGAVIPFSAEVGVEEQPTISYLPVRGDEMLEQLLDPMSVDLALSVLSIARDRETAWRAIVKRFNDLQNVEFVGTTPDGGSEGFDEAVQILCTLQSRGLITFQKSDTGRVLIIREGSGSQNSAIARLLSLLKVNPKRSPHGEIMLVINSSSGLRAENELSLETRSLISVMQLAASRIEVPSESVADAMTFGEPSALVKGLKIRSSSSEPDNARVSVKYRGYWYYIDQTDEASKRWFALLEILSSASIRQPSGGGPLLTVSASK